jgi:hypothetical protein
MTEQNDTTKPGRLRRFLSDFFTAIRCIFIVLLVILLIAGLYFKAPWKVITLIAIILSTLTIIPKPARKWIWLTFRIIVVSLTIWVFLPDEDGNWRPYTFDEELAALEAKRTIPDDQNAATIYNKLLEIYDSNEFSPYPDFLDDDLDELTSSQAWSTKDYPELAKWLAGHESTISTLIEAGKVGMCRFPIGADIRTFAQLVDRLRPMKNWVQLLVRSGNNDVGEGYFDKALEKYLTVIQIAKHLNQQPMMINWLSGLAVEAMGIGRLNQLVMKYDLPSEQLDDIENAIGPVKNCWPSDWRKILDAEIVYTKNECGRFYEINNEGKVRLSPDPRAAFREIYPHLPKPHYWTKKLCKGATILEWFYFPTTPQKAAMLVDNKFKIYYDMAQPDFDWQQYSPESMEINLDFLQPIKILPGVYILERIYFIFHDQYLKQLARRRGCRLLVEIKRYRMKNGRWPDGFSEISDGALAEIFVDPTNNDSFVYKLTEDGFTLYSKGKNNIDEGGLQTIIFDANDLRWPGEKEDDILIWPPESRKNRK